MQKWSAPTTPSIVSDGEGTEGVTAESAIVTAQANRELAAATMVSAETITFAVDGARKFIDFSIRHLGGEIGVAERPH
jgi:hypothetical protein